MPEPTIAVVVQVPSATVRELGVETVETMIRRAVVDALTREADAMATAMGWR